MDMTMTTIDRSNDAHHEDNHVFLCQGRFGYVVHTLAFAALIFSLHGGEKQRRRRRSAQAYDDGSWTLRLDVVIGRRRRTDRSIDREMSSTRNRVVRAFPELLRFCRSTNNKQQTTTHGRLFYCDVIVLGDDMSRAGRLQKGKVRRKCSKGLRRRR